MTKPKPNIILIGGGGHCVPVIDVIEQEVKYCCLIINLGEENDFNKIK